MTEELPHSAIKITPPEPIKLHHRLEDFDCDNKQLNSFLQKRAITNEGKASRTYIVTDGEFNTIGFYTLAVGSIEHEHLTGKVKRNMPNPIPVTILGRLAVDKYHQNLGIGAGMLRDALLKTIEISEVVGVRAVLVHAISEEAKQFYIQRDFEQSPIDDMTLILPLNDIVKNYL